ncbi:MAG: hypothetical protein HFJ02_04720 [Bacilli bacterium]|nr:hypothetical protein [Bacilli bacterium]
MTISFYKDDLKIEEKQVINQSQLKSILEFEFLDYKTTIDLETKTLIRENEEFLFFLDFLKKECSITLKKEKLELNIGVDYCSFSGDNNIIILEYTIETEDKKNKMMIKKGNK